MVLFFFSRQPHDIKFLEEVQRNNKGSGFWFSSKESGLLLIREKDPVPLNSYSQLAMTLTKNKMQISGLDL